MTVRPPATDTTELRRRALSRWENEGGAIASITSDALLHAPDMSNAELVHLRVRVIALENLVIAMLSEGTDRQLQIARDMALYIAPRTNFTTHPLTTQGAHHMTDLVDRAIHFRTLPPL